MTPHEMEKVRRRLGGGAPTPNASGARAQEAPAILAGSEPSRELTPPVPTPEEIAATAEHNRNTRVNPGVAARAAADALPPDPVNGVDEDAIQDAVHEDVLTDDELLDRETPQEKTDE